MSYFTPVKHPDEKYYLFGSGGGEQLAEKLESELLAQIPLIQDVSEYTDKGKSLFESGNEMLQKPFENLANTLMNKLNNQ